jgi:broad-specificity NMP kinase
MTASESAGLIYVTGIAGTGKSTVRGELDHRGYEAHEVDGEFADFFHTETGERSTSHTLVERTPEWRKYHDWIFMEEPLKKLQQHAQNRLVFLCGMTYDEKSYWNIFEKTFALVLNNETLEQRLRGRTGNAWGKSPHELAETLALNEAQNEEYRRLGAIIIDATKPPNEVVEEILQALPGR